MRRNKTEYFRIANLKKFFSDKIEAFLRALETLDQTIVLNGPERPLVPVFWRRLEPKVYNTAKPDELTWFDSLTNQIVIGSLILLGLEFLLDSFVLQFAVLNLVVLGFFIFEFCVRFNYRRLRYLRTWGLVDLPIIVLEVLLLWQVYLIYFSPPSGVMITLSQISLDHSLLHNPTSGYPEWLEQLALWKGLRLLRLLRVFKLARDVARRQRVWARRLGTIAAYIRAFIEALIILAGVLLVLVIITKFTTDQDPQELLRTLSRNVIARLRADQDTGVENSEVLKAIYQVAAILTGMIIITFFTQLLLPIARRIQATKEEGQRELGKTDHVVIAVVDEDAVGLVEEALQVWGVHVGHEVVLLAPDETELDDPIHPKCKPEIVRGSIYSRGSWLAVDASRAEQIIILATEEVDPSGLSIFLPRFEDQATSRNVIILSRHASEPYVSITDGSGLRFACMSADALVEAIERNITNFNSVQYKFIEHVNQKLNAEADIVDAGTSETGPQSEQVAQAIDAHLKEAIDNKSISCRAQDGLILVEIEGDPSEEDEGVLIATVQQYIRDHGATVQTYIFVDSLHLVGLNSQLEATLSLSIVPIELLVMFAVYHETICPKISEGWLLSSDAFESAPHLAKVPSPFSRVTYRTRAELLSEISSEHPDATVLGLLSGAEPRKFRGFLTDTVDTRKVFKDDLIVAIV